MSKGSFFSPPAAGRTLYITVGNTLRGDDGAGPAVARRLAEVPGLLVKDAGDRPERAMEWAEELRPDRVIFIDAADFGGVAGEIREILPGSLSCSTCSTHRIPLPLIAAWIASEIGVPCRCIGIQPADVSLGERLSPEVQQAVTGIVRELAAVGESS